jgi:glutamate dehydrogenase
MNFYWERDKVLTRLDQKMTNTFQAILEASQQHAASICDAAYIVPIDHIFRAIQFRWWLS